MMEVLLYILILAMHVLCNLTTEPLITVLDNMMDIILMAERGGCWGFLFVCLFSVLSVV